MANLTLTSQLAGSIFDTNTFVGEENNQLGLSLSGDEQIENVIINDTLSSDLDLSPLALQSLRLNGVDEDGDDDTVNVTINSDTSVWLNGDMTEDTLNMSLADADTSSALNLVLNGSLLRGIDSDLLETDTDTGAITGIATGVTAEDITSATINADVNLGDEIETLNIDSQANKNDADITGTGTSGVELLSAVEDRNLVTNLNVTGGANVESIVVSGPRAFSLTNVSALTSLATFDASALNSSLTLDVSGVDNTVDITGSDQNDVITVGENDSVSAGAGNDRVDIDYSSIGSLGTLDGGEGNNDSLRINFDDGQDLTNFDVSSIDGVTGFERVTFYTGDNDVTFNADSLSSLEALRFADVDPSDGDSVTNTDGTVIGNGNDLSVSVTGATAEQRIDALDGGDLSVTAAEGVESLSIRANFLNNGTEEGESVTLEVANAEGSDSLSTLDLGGDGRIAYDAGSDDAQITTINAGTLTGGLTLTGGDADLAETITLAQWEESYNGTGRDDINVDSAIGLQGDLIDTVENFDVARDTVSYEGTAITSDSVIESADVSGASSLLGAFQAASETEGLGEGQYAAFSFDGDTYLYRNTNTGSDVTDGADSADFALRFDGEIDFSALADNSDAIVDVVEDAAPAEGEGGGGNEVNYNEVTSNTGTDGEADRFVISDGSNETITNFEDAEPETGDDDILDFSGVANTSNYDSLDITAVDTDSDSVNDAVEVSADSGNTTVTLAGITDPAQITAEDFTFA